MSARDKLYAYAGTPCVLPESMLDEALDAYRTEVVAARDAEIMRWLGKKAREYRASGRRQDAQLADVITLMASQISRGAVRPNNTLLPAGVAPRFFEPGRTYTSGTWEFRCVAQTPSPTTGEPRALGWKFAPVYDVHHWHAIALDPDDWTHGGWTETAPARQGPVSQHYDKVPDPADGCHWCACGNRWPCKDAPAVTA
jgi:hypothetical protein